MSASIGNWLRRALAGDPKKRDQVREIDGYDVSCHDQRDLRVPDERRINYARLDLVASRAEDIPPPAERVGQVPYYPLPLDEQVRVVVGHLVGDGDRHRREHVSPGEQPEAHTTPPEGWLSFTKPR